MSLARRIAVLVLAGACSSDKAEPPPPPPPPPPPSDAAVVEPVPPPREPTGMHLDPYVPSTGGRPAAKPAGRQIEVMLRSTPAGAQVAVDGIEIGKTPQLWQGLTGEHEFTFRLPGHALARYRFHVITTGVVHGRLDPVAREPDAGKPPPELVPPGIAPPSTIVDPLDSSPKLRPDAAPPRLPPAPPADAAVPIEPTAPTVAPDAAPSGGLGPSPF